MTHLSRPLLLAKHAASKALCQGLQWMLLRLLQAQLAVSMYQHSHATAPDISCRLCAHCFCSPYSQVQQTLSQFVLHITYVTQNHHHMLGSRCFEGLGRVKSSEGRCQSRSLHMEFIFEARAVLDTADADHDRSLPACCDKQHVIA